MNEWLESQANRKHAIHCLNLDYHQCFDSLRGCKPCSGMLLKPWPLTFSEKVVPNVVTDEQLQDWLDHTDAKITYIGKPISKRNALDTQVIWCTERLGNRCAGVCMVYTGGPRCIVAGPHIECLTANANVAFCEKSGCGGTCNLFSSCATHLDNNFCYTPGTVSIRVS